MDETESEREERLRKEAEEEEEEEDSDDDEEGGFLKRKVAKGDNKRRDRISTLKKLVKEAVEVTKKNLQITTLKLLTLFWVSSIFTVSSKLR